MRAVKNYQNNNYQNNNYQKPWKKSNFVKISSEILRSERGSINEDSSHIREKVILLCIIENPNLITGKIEIVANDVTVLSKAKTLPFQPGDKEVNGDGRKVIPGEKK